MQAVPGGTYDGITLTRRHPLIGAEIRGVDLGQVDDEAFRRIYDAWLEHLLLVFPGQNVTDEEQIAFARRFGDLEIHPSREHRSSRHPEIYRVANVDEHGNIMPQDSKGWRYMNLTWLWHTDSSFREVPSMGSILHGIEVPPEGGDTLFANMYAVYEALSGRHETACAGSQRRAQPRSGTQPRSEAEELPARTTPGYRQCTTRWSAGIRSPAASRCSSAPIRWRGSTA